METQRRSSTKIKSNPIKPLQFSQPLAVNLSQVDSALLMLKSEECEAQSLACEALYKFINGDGGSKLEVLSNTLCGSLFPLLLNENKIVKRNAMLVYSAVSRWPSARMNMQRDPSYRSTFNKLLQQNEFNSTKELVLLTIAEMCSEMSFINDILTSNLLDSILEFMNDKDPDIQKNSLLVVFKAVKDYKARCILRKSSVLKTLLHLLSSEYPVIQQLTLQILARAAQDRDIRAALCDKSALHTIIGFLTSGDSEDLHQYALNVIAILLEDGNSAKYLQTSGYLLKLLHFLSEGYLYKDSDLPEEKSEQQKKSLAPKKGKKDNPKKKETPKPNLTDLSELKFHACQAVMRAAKNSEVRRILHDVDVEQLLCTLLSNDDDRVRSSAALAIAALAKNTGCQERVLQLEALELLIRMARNDERHLRTAGVTAIAALTSDNLVVCRELASRMSGIESVLNCFKLTSPEDEDAISQALSIIQSLNTDKTTRRRLRRQLSVAELIALIEHSSTIIQAKTASTIAMVVSDVECVECFCQNRGVEALTKLLASSEFEVRRNASWAIYNLALYPTVVKILVENKAIEHLHKLNQDELQKNRFSELAYYRLLDADLNAKFAITGYLDFTDLIKGRFYDPGPMPNVGHFQLLKYYLRQPLEDDRAVLLINIESDQKLSHEEGHEETETTVEETQFTLKPDGRLVEWLEEVRESIQPLAEANEQAEQLGIFVVERYGGPIHETDHAKFRPEMSIAKLRCELGSNVVPIGCIDTGNQLVRALLFKFLADQIGLPSNLVRGSFGRSYNEIQLCQDCNENNECHVKVEKYVVDLMFRPGALLKANSAEARKYIMLS